MKTKIFSFLAIASMFFASTSCHDEHWGTKEEPSEEGRVNLANIGLEVNTDHKVVESRGVLDEEINTDSYLVSIKRKANGVSVGEYTYSTRPKVVVLPSGDYTIEIKSHEVKKEDWDMPYFVGSTDFTVKKDEITDIGKITCTFQSIAVSIRYSNQLAKILGEDTEVEVLCNDYGRLVFTKDETRTAFFEAVKGSKTLIANFTSTIYGKKVSLSSNFDDIEAGQHRIITFKVKDSSGTIPDETGSVEVNGELFSIDSQINDVSEDIQAVIEEEILSSSDRPGQEVWGDDPVVEEDIKIYSDNFDITKINTPKVGADYTVVIEAKNGIKNLIVEIVSNSLNDDLLGGVGLKSKFDLAEPGDLEEKLSDPDGFNFPVKDNVIGKTQVTFDITKFVPLLNIYPGEQHSFKLTVIDLEGNEKTTELKFQT